MAVTSELTVLHRAVDELRGVVVSVRGRYGDVPAVKPLLEDLLPPAPEVTPGEMQVIDDSPPDPARWTDADDEGVGGYHGGSR